MGQRLSPVRDNLAVDAVDAELVGELARRQLPQPAEQPRRRAADERDVSAVFDPHRGPRDSWQRRFRLARRDDRQLAPAPGLAGFAVRGERAGQARRRRRRAQRRAELHQALVEIARRRVGGQRRHQLAGARPQRTLTRGRLDVVLDREHAREHAGDVAVDERRALAKRDRRDRACGVRPDAGHRSELGGAARQRAGESRRDLARTGVEVARTRVVAEAGPRGEDVIERCVGERLRRREARHPALPVRDHRTDARLLEHDLGDPDRVRVARASPRQIAPRAREVSNDGARDVIHASVY